MLPDYNRAIRMAPGLCEKWRAIRGLTIWASVAASVGVTLTVSATPMYSSVDLTVTLRRVTERVERYFARMIG